MFFQQNKKGDHKIKGIKKYGSSLFDLDIIDIDIPLPTIIEDCVDFLPETIEADLVLDYLTHPDLSMDLASFCIKKKIPVIASGKKIKGNNIFTPPT